ncbi:hypothetical protein VNI00_005956 [Paramarasmius palmivorus]|uniref:DUF6593 domain-containing protein n=1 Tax=Paramarasmius palmivorus TaxID=297713 RepID=A0AAW0DG28_9AGAR
MNPFSAWNSGDGVPPSVYGALPAADSSTLPSLVFTFAPNPSLLNCTVMGPNNATHFYVVTDPNMPTYTVFKAHDGKSLALIEWQQTPQVELRGLVAKQAASSFLKLSSDQRFRIMQIAGQEYLWIPSQNSIALYPAGVHANSNTRLAQISRGASGVVLEINRHAAQAGLLPACVVATVLLQSGRNFG